ncbi:MAG: hypothetical protein ABIL62_00440 [Planctomycetota bacterium]
MTKYVICMIIALILFPLFVVLAILIYLGLPELPETLLLFLILPCVFLCSLVILLPLSFFSMTRTWAGYGFYTASFVCGITGWSMGLLLSWELWGPIAVIIGLFIFGIGVVPIAMLATLFNGMWIELGFLVLAIILTFGFRFFGIGLVEKAREMNEYKQGNALAELKRMKEELIRLRREDKLKPYQEEQLISLERAIARFSAEQNDNKLKDN